MPTGIEDADALDAEDITYWHGERNLQPWYLYNGDAREALYCLPEGSVDCVVTSPPYFSQRDYGVDGQIGLERTIDEYVEAIVESFDGVRHALAKDGTAFLNLGDTYYSAKGEPHGADSKNRARRFGLRAADASGLGLPRKSLIGIPWRVALALSANGWTLRSAITWARTRPIPEPTAHDRPWRQYENIFMLTKGPKYYFDRSALGSDEDIWYFDAERNPHGRGVHFATFPQDLVRRCIGIGCPVDGNVLDPFVGTGTTMAVAADMGRASVGVELNPEFCNLALARMALDE